MLIITNVPLSIKGSRVEADTEIEIDANEVASLDRNDYRVKGEVVEKVVAPEPVKALAEMSVGELKAKAEALGLSKAGSKADLLERITLNGPVQGEFVPEEAE